MKIFGNRVIMVLILASLALGAVYLRVPVSVSTESQSHPPQRLPGLYSDLVAALKNGATHDVLPSLPGGVQEFDVVVVDNLYHFYYTNPFGKGVKYRSAESISAIHESEEKILFPNRAFPSVRYENRAWHLWVCDTERSMTEHYTASLPYGPFILQKDTILQKCDVNVRKSPYDYQYYAVYKDIYELNNSIGIMTASTPYGPWKDLGYIFTEATKSAWHRGEEADPSLFFSGNRAYIVFAGNSAISATDPMDRQMIGIAELDVSLGKATAPAAVVVLPEEDWHKANGSIKVYSPIILRDTITGDRTRLFYSHNPSASTEHDAWSYILAQ